MALGNLDFAGLQALLAEQGLELVLRPIATPTTNVLQDVTNRPAVQPAVQPAKQTSSAPKSVIEPVPVLGPTSSIKPTPGSLTNVATNLSTKAPARPPQHPPVHYSPYQHSSRPSLPAPVQSDNPKSLRPPIKLRYMKRPRGTPGRKGKDGWPQPMRHIWGTTVAEYRFMYGIAKCLVYKKLDTTKCLRDQDEDLVDWFYYYIPEFVEVYGGSKWPARAFIQVALKSSTDAHKRLAKGINSNIKLPNPSFAMPEEDDVDEDDMLAEANVIVDGYCSEDELATISVSSDGKGNQRADKALGYELRFNVAYEDEYDSELGEPAPSELDPSQPAYGLVFDYEDEE
ncbi:hypothetical protein RSOL_431710 [Rhizoctonia solani AG-3 Rhs1AP]|uniref:Uncharacterized protein n=1 Tax=Rhizoctonia solani AG-3 Rhs1AP TaxID=1086054 RepID=X8JKY7_9AGAM|nr:hypothetical protein RSOL_431710 [Rhizoctonia solani AG-3 Rhs1AP]